MRKTIIMALLLLSCGAEPFVSRDEDPRYCAHQYPIDESPDFCESTSSGDCCTWEDISTSDGICRYDFCSFYEDPGCNWALQYQECTEGE